MVDPTFPLFPLFAFLGFVVTLIPLPWHLQAWNSGTCAFIFWTSSVCLVEFVNSIIWNGNMDNVAPVWCDISIQIMLGSGIGMPASVLCVSRRLYKITSIQTVSVTREDKRKDIIIDMLIAFGIPMLALVLHTIVHAHRFNILEEIGCYPVTYSTLAAYFVYYSWPIVLGCVSFVYSAFTLRSFFRRRVQFGSLPTSSAMNINRYIRLMALSIADMSLTVPFAIYTMYIGTHGIKLAPWISWEETHYDWNRVDAIPAALWRNNTGFLTTVELTRWLPVFCGFIFFALFGFASEAKKNYKKAFWAAAKLVGYKPKSQPIKFALSSWTRKPAGKTESQTTLPVYSFSHTWKRKGSSFCSPLDESVELGLYSPEPEKSMLGSPTSPASIPPAYSTSRSSLDATASVSQHGYVPSVDVEIASTRFSTMTSSDYPGIGTSNAQPVSWHPSASNSTIPISAPPPAMCFEDNFKPLPPLPSAIGEPRRYTSSHFTPYASPVPLRHTTSMPLPQQQSPQEYEFPIPLYQRPFTPASVQAAATGREREGSITVIVEQTTRVEAI